MFGKITRRVRAHYSRAHTASILRSLDDRELNDLGIGRWQIDEVVRKQIPVR